jgi:hypothetical protein
MPNIKNNNIWNGEYPVFWCTQKVKWERSGHGGKAKESGKRVGNWHTSRMEIGWVIRLDNEYSDGNKRIYE